MSIRPMDMQNIYLRMGEVAKEHDKEIKKEDRERSFQKRIQKFREEAFDHSVSQTRESHAEQTVKEHEDHGLPLQRSEHQEKDQVRSSPKHRSAEDIALPMLTLHEKKQNHNSSHHVIKEELDPDLGRHIDIIS